MKVNAIITGATGMVGKGVLLECLEHPEVERVLVINRSAVGISHPKLKEIIHANFFDVNSLAHEFKNYNAVYFCLGVSSVGMSEKKFSQLTYDLTIHFAQTLASVNKEVTFCYVSGQGTDSSEKGRIMWARVKGKTENAILKMGFKDAYMFRPNAIIPEKGIKSKTNLYNILYVVMRPFYPLLRKMTGSISTSITLGKAMINVVLKPQKEKYLENAAINIKAH